MFDISLYELTTHGRSFIL